MNISTLVCCIAKLENYYIREWVEWYKAIGVSNICLYDNNELDGETFNEVIGDYIESGFVIIEDVRGKEKMQLPCYQHCYDKYGKKYNWIGFFDADEYMEIENGTISDFLSMKEWDNAGAIRLCWKNYDDNNLLRVVDGNYSIKRFNTLVNPNDICNRTSKVIVRGGLDIKIYQKPGGAHGQYLNCVSIDCHGNYYDNSSFVLNERVWDIAWLRHYRFKTIDEYLNLKLARLYPDVDKKTARKWLDINSFWEYNERTKEKEEMYKNFIFNKKVGCFIFNYNKDKSAARWYNSLKDFFPTYILDTFHRENKSHFNIINDVNIIEYDNILFGGLTKKAYEIAKKEGYEWVMTITSDVFCDNLNIESLRYCVLDIIKRGDIGVWEPSAVLGSYVNGSTMRIKDNKHQYYWGTNNIREVKSGEGWFEFVSIKVMDKVMPYTNYEDNKYGWGLNDAFNRASRKLNLKVVIDDRVVMFHPPGTGYNNLEASKEYKIFKNKFKEMGLEEEEIETSDELMTLICCIGKNENKYVREYVEWYKNIGVTHIRIYDNNDLDGEHFEDVIGDYINSGYVDIVDYRGLKLCQLQAYEECYKELGGYYDWVLFIDCGDEYLQLMRHNNISDYLSSECFKNYDMLHINLMTFGDNGQVEVSDRPLLERFPQPIPFETKIAYDFPENAHISSIVRGGLPELLFKMSPHTPYPNKLRCCDDIGNPVDSESPFSNISYRGAFFRHYTTKTAYEYCNKMKRGFPDFILNGDMIKNLIETRFFRTNEVTKEKIEIFKKELDIDMSYLLPKKFEGEKSKDVKIFSLCYDKKKFEFIDDEVVTPLQVGAANGKEVCDLKDNTGDNISDKNYFFIENTGIYWIWKNIKDAKYKGQMQYRRPLNGVNKDMNFDEIFRDYDVITCEPFHHPSHKTPTKEEPMFIPADTVEQGYAFSNCADDLYIMEMVVKMTMPEYADSWDKYIKNGSNLYYSNGFIMRSEDYDKYCEFLFKCLNGYLEMTGINSIERLRERVVYHMEVGKYPKHMNPQERSESAVRWQMSIGGFLSERLWTLWLLHNFKEEKIKKLPYIKMEEGMYT